MAIAEKYSKKEDIPEGFEDDYTEYDDNGEKVFILRHLIGALQAKAHEKEARKKETEALKAAQEKIAAQEALDKKRRDEIEEARKKELETSGKWEELRKLEEEKRLTDKAESEKAIAALNAKLKAMEEAAEREKIGAYCSKISAEIALPGAVESLRLLIELKRTKMVDGQLVVLDRAGMAVSWDKDQLIADIKDDPFFAPLIQGSKATGGGAVGGGSGAAPGKPFKDYTEQERVQLFLTKPEKFRELAAAEKLKGK